MVYLAFELLVNLFCTVAFLPGHLNCCDNDRCAVYHLQVQATLLRRSVEVCVPFGERRLPPHDPWVPTTMFSLRSVIHSSTSSHLYKKDYHVVMFQVRVPVSHEMIAAYLSFV